MARPSFKIDTNRLRSLRKESQFTQLKAAQKTHEILNKPSQTADTTILSSYQRIERTGNTSKSMATALAQVFDTTVEILQGADVPEDSANFLSRVKQQLSEQHKSGKNPTLLHTFDLHQQTYSSPVSEDDCMHEFATDIATQIELAQIGQNASEIARLTALTGWSAQQLQQPGGVHGHWLLLTSINGSRETEIVLGVADIRFRIQETFEKWTPWQESDVRIKLSRSLPWFHIEISHPRIPGRRCKFSFVRCRPEITGLKWVNPTWLDEFWLEEPLQNWAFNKANVVTCFEGKNMPDDVRRLRFRVRERNAHHAFQRIAYSKGNLDGLPEQVFQDFKTEGDSHSIVMNWLTNGFSTSLAPYLTAYPRKCWTIRPGTCHIAVLLQTPLRLVHENKDLIPFEGMKYSIDLVEEVSPGDFVPAPWRDSSVAEICRLLEERLFETPNANEPVDALQFLTLPVSAG